MTEAVKNSFLVIGMLDSIHLARWLENATFPTTFRLILIPTSPMRRIHPRLKSWLKEMNKNANCHVSISALLRFAAIPIWLIDRDFFMGRRVLGLAIRFAIARHKPSQVHLFETQGAGYGYLRYARSLGRLSPSHKLILTLFGSDLFWFKDFPAHSSRLEQLMPLVNLLETECSRDVELAKSLGFIGRALPQMPVGGGVSLNGDRLSKTGLERDVIAIKGYGGKWGLGHVAIPILAKYPELLFGKTVVLYSASRRTAAACRKYLKPIGVTYRVYKRHSLTHESLLAIFRHTWLHIGLSKSDGLPASMLEAMSQGAFPIQTNTACLDGWVQPGVSGLTPDPSASGFEKSIIKIVSGQIDFDAARSVNHQVIQENYNLENLRKRPEVAVYGASTD